MSPSLSASNPVWLRTESLLATNFQGFLGSQADQRAGAMIDPKELPRIYFYCDPVDMQKQMISLARFFVLARLAPRSKVIEMLRINGSMLKE